MSRQASNNRLKLVGSWEVRVMRMSVVVPVFFLVAMAFASEQPWPAKGDTVYISASFKKLSAPSPVGGAQMQYDMPACAEVVIVKANPKKSLWVTKDPVGGTEQLEGAWTPRMHKSKSECEAQFSSDGEPSVSRSGNTFKIGPSEAK